MAMLTLKDVEEGAVIWLYPWWYMDPRRKELFLARVTKIKKDDRGIAIGLTVKAIDAQGEYIDIPPAEVDLALGRSTARIATQDEVKACLRSARAEHLGDLVELLRGVGNTMKKIWNPRK